MKPNPSFLRQPTEFWAMVKYISETLGYSDRNSKGSRLKRYNYEQLRTFEGQCIVGVNTLRTVLEYLNYRAALIEEDIQPLLMNKEDAEKVFKNLISNYKPKCALPLNKQKGNKRHYNYLTCIVNIITERNLNKDFDDNPRKLCYVTDQDNKLVATFSRWMDGAFPGVENPSAVWEVKEYYGTTTFGSRVADGVYESQLDGYEIRDAQKASGRKIEHYLFVDDRFTWWIKGKSYLCRLIDMMHVGLVDEVIFGKEVITRWPEIVKTWR